jgi:hypothetical protein
MKTIIATVVRFSRCKESENHWKVHLLSRHEDEYTGYTVNLETKYVWLVPGKWSTFVGKTCELTLDIAPKLNKHICIGARLVSEKGEDYEEAF